MERPAVWLTIRPTWEPTATIGYIRNGMSQWATIPEMVAHTGPLLRFAFAADVARHTTRRRATGPGSTLGLAAVKRSVDDDRQRPEQTAMLSPSGPTFDPQTDQTVLTVQTG